MKDLEIKVKLVRDANSVQAAINDAKRVVAAEQDAAKGIQQGRDALGKFVAGSSKARADAEIVNIKAILTAEQAAQFARNQIVDKANAAMVASSLKAIDRQAWAQSSLTDKIKDGGSALLHMAGGWAGVGNAAVQAASAVADLWSAQQKDIENSVKGLASYREHLLGLAALNGNFGRTSPELAKQLDFRNRTLQDQAGAVRIQEGILNTGQAAKASGFLTDKKDGGATDEFSAYMELVGRHQAGNPALDAKSLGTLAGSLPNVIGTKGQTAQQTYSRLAGILATFSAGGADPSPAVTAFQGNLSLVGNGTDGLFRSPEQLAAATSQFTLNHPIDSQTMIRQFIEATAGGTVKGRKIGVEGAESQADYLQSLNLKSDSDPIEIARSIQKDLAKQEADAKGKGENFRTLDYLKMHGFTNSESARSIMEFSKSIGSGQYDATFAKRETPASAPAFADAVKPLDDFLKSPEALRRRGELATDAASIKKSIGAEEFTDSLYRIAFQDLRSEGKVTGLYEDWSKSNSIWKGPVIDRAKEMLDKQADAVGLPRDASESGLGARIQGALYKPLGALGFGVGQGSMGGSLDARLYTSEATRAQAFYERGVQVSAKGGTPGDLTALIDLTKKQVDLAQKAEDRANRPVPVGPPVRQAGPPAKVGR